MIPLIDTHQHLIFRDQFTYRWTAGLEALSEGDFTVTGYQELTEGKGVISSVFMEVDADEYQAEARFVSTLATDPANRICGVIASCRPEDRESFDGWLEECSNLSVTGFRRILHEAPDELSTTKSFRENVQKIGRSGKVFDIVVRADQLAIAHELAATCDQMQLVLDHCGVPDIASGEFQGWAAGISKVAELPHVACKISGVLAYCGAGNASLDAIKPYVLHVIDVFGPDRLVWGSDWPVVNITSSLPDWIDIFRALISDLSANEQAAICNGNANKIYQLA